MNSPAAYHRILEATIDSGFNMASDQLTCTLLATLAATKPKGRLLELGTGTGLSTAWILHGMSSDAHLTSIDNAGEYLNIARTHLAGDDRLTLVLADGDEWVNEHKQEKFDFIFADTWPGKYRLLDEVIGMLHVGGIYLVDDMLPQANWPEGHNEKATAFTEQLLQRADLHVTRLDWATGIMIGVKIDQ